MEFPDRKEVFVWVNSGRKASYFRSPHEILFLCLIFIACYIYADDLFHGDTISRRTVDDGLCELFIPLTLQVWTKLDRKLGEQCLRFQARQKE